MGLSAAGIYNTAVGNTAMFFGSASESTAVGDSAMYYASGNDNVALGREAGLNFTGSYNIAIGAYAGQSITTGSNNIEIGSQGAKKDDSVIRIGDTATQKKTFIAGINGVKISNGVAVVINKQGQLGVAASTENAENTQLRRELTEEHREVAALEAKVASLEATVEKVSAQVQIKTGHARVVSTNE
jgi:hypothetical protein